LPSEDSIAQAIFDGGGTPDPSAIYEARSDLSYALADHMTDDLMGLYLEMDVAGPYNPNSRDAGKRALRATMLGLMTKMEPDARSARAQFANADNMTESLSALSCLIRADHGSNAVSAFYDRWRDDKLVIDKWFAIQVASATPLAALATAERLAKHSEFDWKNPNRFRSLIGPYAMNPAAFHQSDGTGYKFVADWLIELDAVNPQTTARMCGLFETWKRYDAGRQDKMLKQLKRISDKDGLSKDVAEIVGKILKA
jgi:aminopeptidase N